MNALRTSTGRRLYTSRVTVSVRFCRLSEWRAVMRSGSENAGQLHGGAGVGALHLATHQLHDLRQAGKPGDLSGRSTSWLLRGAEP